MVLRCAAAVGGQKRPLEFPVSSVTLSRSSSAEASAKPALVEAIGPLCLAVMSGTAEVGPAEVGRPEAGTAEVEGRIQGITERPSVLEVPGLHEGEQLLTDAVTLVCVLGFIRHETSSAEAC